MRPGFVRIIAGKWRGRRLPLAADAALRPTPDRVRETVFNWLAPYLPGAYCLDAFAGTGVFGFEALSRGAAQAVFVDNSLPVITMLKTFRDTLQATDADIYCACLPQGLQPVARAFDIVFIDPPYASNLLLETCRYLETQHYLAAKAYIYLEANTLIKDNELPDNWRLLKAKHAGAVYYHLAERTSL